MATTRCPSIAMLRPPVVTRSQTEIVDYIADDNPTAAISVKERIEQATAHLSANPRMGRQGRIDGTRELIVSGLPYIIPYRLRFGRVEILDVIHRPSSPARPAGHVPRGEGAIEFALQVRAHARMSRAVDEGGDRGEELRLG